MDASENDENDVAAGDSYLASVLFLPVMGGGPGADSNGCLPARESGVVLDEVLRGRVDSVDSDDEDDDGDTEADGEGVEAAAECVRR